MSHFRGALAASICVGLIASNPSVSTFVGKNLLVGSALAKDGGNDGGHGNDNGQSGGNEGKSESHQGAAASSRNGKTSRLKALSTAVSAVDPEETNRLGALNAIHASPRAIERASPKSAVGKIAAYRRARAKALAITDPTQQALALDAAISQLNGSFGRILTTAQISKINAFLDAD